jgi:ABC-2 type transport system permease protein
MTDFYTSASSQAHLNLAITIASRVLKTTLTGWRGRLITIFWLVLVALATWSGATACKAEWQAYDTGEAAVIAAFSDWRAAYGSDPWRPVDLAAEHPIVRHLPPAPGRALAAGVSDAVGTWAAPANYHQRELEGRKGELTPLGILFGTLDLAGLVGVAGALLTIALGFDGISAEKERGTLALHFANPLGRGTFLLGKLLGVFAVVGCTLWLPLLLGVTVLGATGNIEASWDGLTRAVLFMLIGLAYLMFWTTASIAVSVMARSSAASVVALASLWLVVALAAPKVIAAEAASRHPVTASALLEEKIPALRAQSLVNYRKKLTAYKNGHHGATPKGVDAARLRLAYYDEFFARIDHVTAIDKTIRVAREHSLQTLAVLSPTLVYQLATAELAGTDGARHRAFIDAVDAYARDLRRWPEQRLITGIDTRPTWNELPPFNPGNAYAQTDLNRAFRHIGILLVLCALAMLAAWLAFLRYDLRLQGA